MAGDQQGSKPRDLNKEALEQIYGSEAEQRAAEESQKAQHEMSCIVRDVFFTDDGRRVLEWMKMSFAGLSFDPGNPHITSFNEGQRQVVLTIQEMIQQAEGEGSVNERP